MKLEKLEIASFGKLDNMTLDLSDGVNIIRGGNESGKTTICNFIKFVFYGLPKSLDERYRYISWRTSVARGAIVFTEGGKRYRVERESILSSGADGKPKFTDKVGVFDALSGELLRKNECPGEIFFGVPAEVFDSTVYIRQLDGTKTGDKSLAEAAENILFSGSESLNTKKALEKLSRPRIYLLHANKKGGKIYELGAQSAQLGEALEQAQQAGGEVIYLEGTVRQLGKKLETAKQSADVIKAELDKYEAYTVKKSYLRYKEELGIQKQLGKEIEELRFAEGFGNAPVYSDEYISHLEGLKSSLSVAEARLGEAKKRYDAAKQRVLDMSEKLDIYEKFGRDDSERDAMISSAAELDAKVRKYSLMKKISAVSAALFAILAIVAVFLGATGVLPSSVPIAIVCGALCIAGFVVFAVSIAKSGDPKTELKQICRTFGCETYPELDELKRAASKDETVLSYIADERDAADGAFKSASDSLDLVNREIITELEAANFTIEKNTVASVDAALEICREQQRALGELEMKKSESEARCVEIEKALGPYEESFIKSACTTEFDEEAMESYDFKSRRRDYDYASASIESITEKIHGMEKQLAALTAVNIRPADIAAKKTEIDGELADLTEKYDAIALAIDAMTNASSNLRRGLAPKIAKGASAIMAELSGGKYESLGVNSELGMTFVSDAATHSVEYLSAGTSDIAYISLRVALIDVLYKKAIPPFIFDESFMRMDNDRMTRSLKLLCEFGEHGTQSLLFTCHGREEKLMKTIGEYTYFTI